MHIGTFPLAVPPETPIRKGVLLSTPLSLMPKDIFRVMPTLAGISAIIEQLDLTKNEFLSERLKRGCQE